MPRFNDVLTRLVISETSLASLIEYPKSSGIITVQNENVEWGRFVFGRPSTESLSNDEVVERIQRGQLSILVVGRDIQIADGLSLANEYVAQDWDWIVFDFSGVGYDTVEPTPVHSTHASLSFNAVKVADGQTTIIWNTLNRTISEYVQTAEFGDNAPTGEVRFFLTTSAVYDALPAEIPEIVVEERVDVWGKLEESTGLASLPEPSQDEVQSREGVPPEPFSIDERDTFLCYVGHNINPYDIIEYEGKARVVYAVEDTVEPGIDRIQTGRVLGPLAARPSPFKFIRR